MTFGIEAILSAGRLLWLAQRHPVSRRQPLRTIARMMAWQWRCRTMPGPHRQDWIEDSCLIVERGMTAATGNLYFGLYEFADMAFLLHFLRKGNGFVDIGANVGTFTVLASKLCEADVLAFEPDPETGHRCARNLAENSLLAIEAETVPDRARARLLDHGFARRYYDPLKRILTESPSDVVAHDHRYVRDIEAVEVRLTAARRFQVMGLAV